MSPLPRPAEIAARVADLATAELELALARAGSWSRLRTEIRATTAEKINAVITAMNNPGTVNANGRGNTAPPIPRITPAAR